MLQTAITSTLKTWKEKKSLDKEMKSLSKEIEDIKKDQVGILEWKNIIT